MTAETQPAGGYVVVPRDDLERIEKKLRHGGWPTDARSVRELLSAAPPPQEPVQFSKNLGELEGGALREELRQRIKLAIVANVSTGDGRFYGIETATDRILAALPSLAQPDAQKVQNGADKSEAALWKAHDERAQGERVGEGHRHTVLMDAINNDLRRQHPEAFEEADGPASLAIPAPGPFVVLDTSALAESALSAPPATGWRPERFDLAQAIIDTGVSIGSSSWPDEQRDDALKLADAILALPAQQEGGE